MANEPVLKIDDIFNIDDYLNKLESKDPEVHSGTLRKADLDDINDRSIKLVPEYQPTTTGISLKNLIDIKSNTIDKDNIQDKESKLSEATPLTDDTQQGEVPQQGDDTQQGEVPQQPEDIQQNDDIDINKLEDETNTLKSE